MSAAAIAGVFCDYKLVRTRSVVQIIVEVAVERQAEVFAALGYPMPGQEIHVAVARLIPSAGKSTTPSQPINQERTAAVEPDGRSPNPPAEGTSRYSPAGEIQRQKYASKSPAEQAVVRAAMLADDERFHAWALGGRKRLPGEAAHYIRERCCDGQSRKFIADRPAYLDRFLAMETEFKIAMGEIAEAR